MGAIATRAVDGVQRPIYQKGELVGYEPVYSDHLLLRLAQRLDPPAWTDRQKLEHSAQVADDAGTLSIAPDEVLLLPETRRPSLKL